MDLGLVMEQRRKIDQLQQEVAHLHGELLRQRAVMDAALKDVQLQFVTVIYSSPDHTVHLSEASYTALPDPYHVIQNNLPDASFTIEVKEGAAPDEITH